jgi:anaerobic magnesium-protoporphyrin IX monomethyl ester cyclase
MCSYQVNIKDNDVPKNKAGLNFTLIALYQDCATGLRYLSSVLKAEGHNCNLVFLNKGEDPRLFKSSNLANLMALIKDLKTDIIGISVFSTYFNIAREVTKEIKKGVDIPVFWGGPHPTFCPDHSILHCDLLCVGEGEICIKQLASKIQRGEKIENIPNLWLKEGSTIIRNEPAPLIIDLDTIPFPDYDLQGKFYVNDKQIPYSQVQLQEMNQKAFHIITSRGCPFPCTFCSNAVLNRIYKGKWTKFRRRSPENVVDELIKARKLLNISDVAIHDEIFATDISWVSKFASLYKKHVNLPFGCCGHPNLIDIEIFSLLKEAGLSSVSIGMQSGSDRMLKEVYHRHTPKERIARSHSILSKLKLVKSYDIMLDNPYDSTVDLRETFRFLLSLKKPFILHTFSYVYLPKTALTERALKDNLISAEDVEGFGHSKYVWRVYWSPGARNSEDVFLKVLISMTGNIFIPNWFLSLLSRSNLLNKRPGLLARFILNPSFERFQTLSQSIYYLTPREAIYMIFTIFKKASRAISSSRNLITTKRGS